MTCFVCQIIGSLNKASTEGGNDLFLYVLYSVCGEEECISGYSGINALLLHGCPSLLSIVTETGCIAMVIHKSRAL